MKKRNLPVVLALAAAPALAEETRQLDAHEHGVGELNIAIDGSTVAMEFHAPGADIVGFEYQAESAEDRAAIDTAVAKLAKPLDLFQLPVEAACSVTQASAELESEELHEDHEHEEHAEDDHEHEDHAEDKHEDHGHDDHADDAHDDHDEEKHAEHAHDDHDHEEHADEAGHTEFHAEYMLTCADPSAITAITFAYFDTFENARELEVQIVTASGAQAFEVERDSPRLDLSNLF